MKQEQTKEQAQNPQRFQFAGEGKVHHEEKCEAAGIKVEVKKDVEFKVSGDKPQKPSCALM